MRLDRLQMQHVVGDRRKPAITTRGERVDDLAEQISGEAFRCVRATYLLAACLGRGLDRVELALSHCAVVVAIGHR